LKTVLLTTLFFSVLFVGCAQMEKANMSSDMPVRSGQHAQAFEKTIQQTVACQYLLFLPDGYGQKRQRWPLVLFLHGAGERGDDLELVKKHGPPKLIEQGKGFPFIIVSPQCPASRWWPEQTDVLMALLDEVTEEYDVDTSRVYLTGLSMGGFGTWSLATRYPERFAAVAPICGGGAPYLAERFKDLPVWAFHGAKDNVVPLHESRRMVDAINAKGGNAKLTVYPHAYHDSWTATYNNQNLYDWFLSHRRDNETK